MSAAEPRYFKTAKTWQYVCTEQGCRFSLSSPSKTEAQSNINLHNATAHKETPQHDSPR